MEQLIDVIRAAIATDATKEAKAAGVQACRTITAALDTEPGKPILLPGTPPQRPLAGVSIDQVLDLMITRLTTIANAHENATAPHQLPPGPSPNGLRVPAASMPLPVARAAARSRPASAAPAAAGVRPVARPRPANARPTNIQRPARKL